METLLFWISHYGYFGIFSLLVLGIVGLPIPDETLLTLSGYLIYKGDLHFVPLFIAAYLGSISGISISYAIGSTFGHHILLKYGHFIHITEDRLQKAHNWFEKIGRWALLLGYFIPGVRHIVAILAGTSELQLWEFIVFAYTGGIIWTLTFISIGYYFGDQWEMMLETVNRHLIPVSIVVLAALFLYYYIKRRNKKNGQNENGSN